MRLEITKKSDRALRALMFLQQRGKTIQSAELAAILETTAGYTPQVMGPLISAGWVTSDPGPTGGYRLDTDLDQVSLLELIEQIEGPTESGRCVLRGSPCPGVGQCALHVPWERARKALLSELAATSIGALVEPPDQSMEGSP